MGKRIFLTSKIDRIMALINFDFFCCQLFSAFRIISTVKKDPYVFFILLLHWFLESSSRTFLLSQHTIPATKGCQEKQSIQGLWKQDGIRYWNLKKFSQNILWRMLNNVLNTPEKFDKNLFKNAQFCFLNKFWTNFLPQVLLRRVVWFISQISVC